MEKEQAIKLAGSARKLAEMLGISRAAISQWGATIPQARVWQLKALQPDWFSS
jgi:DNA-binding transcriptional regulator YdaS (Cro superfamily)